MLNTININDKIVNQYDLYLSLIVSCFNLVYNLYKLKSESKFHCMPFAIYALSVLQLGMLYVNFMIFDIFVQLLCFAYGFFGLFFV